ncbi:MAG: GGDEF domain-containing protein [Clostridiaceae bacterium]|nr:GGDEF domain-containing protein [Clostridiaceae bacterium]
MDVLHFCGLSALIFILSCPFHHITIYFARIMKPEGRLSHARGRVYQTASLACTMMLTCFNIPLPLFYLLLYGILCAAFLNLPGDKSCNWFIINQIMIFYTILPMLILGILALISGTGLKGILERDNTRLLSIITALVIFYLLSYSLFIPGLKDKIRVIPQCPEEFSLYVKYTWFALAYILFDSFSALFDMHSCLIVLFLLGSSSLILLKTFVFLNHICKIAQNVYLEEEHRTFLLERKLQMEREKILRHKMHVDYLTGAYTRRYVEDNIQDLIKNKKPFTLVYIDLDFLKRVNDTLGHDAGDEHLKDFVRIFGGYLRKNDIFARVGGDEFYVVLPDCDIETAHGRMAFIQSRLLSENHCHNEFPLSFSFGLSMSGPGKGMETLIGEADHSMYSDKQARRKV